MPRFLRALIAPPATPTAERIIEAVLGVCYPVGLYGLLLFTPLSTAAALALLAGSAWFNKQRRRAAEGMPRYRCGQQAEAYAHLFGWVICVLAGPLMAAFGQHPATRAAGLSIIACSAVITFSDHSCRFSKRCHRLGPWEEHPDLSA